MNRRVRVRERLCADRTQRSNNHQRFPFTYLGWPISVHTQSQTTLARQLTNRLSKRIFNGNSSRAPQFHCFKSKQPDTSKPSMFFLWKSPPAHHGDPLLHLLKQQDIEGSFSTTPDHCRSCNPHDSANDTTERCHTTPFEGFHDHPLIHYIVYVVFPDLIVFTLASTGIFDPPAASSGRSL